MVEYNMKIALDYDGTFTTDPKCWRKVIDLLQKYGHEITIATSRFKTLGNYNEISKSTGLPVLFCDHNAKAESAKKHGISFDVWIDDDPWAIVGVDK
jgi:hypothetical protein